MIGPESIPRIEGDMAALAGHANAIAAAGEGFAATGASVHAGWQRLGAVYTAPEAGQLLAATAPVATVSASVGEDLGSAAAALNAYASEVAAIQARLDALRAQAAGGGTGVGEPDLDAGVAAAMAAWEAAQLRCANALRALSGAPPLVAAAPTTTGPDVAAGGVTHDDPVLAGMPPTSGFAADPVCTATGHFVEVEVDLDAPPTAGLLAWTRVYGSRHGETGPFGRGWWSWASSRIEWVVGGVRFTGPDGRRAVFAPVRGGYARVAGIAGVLADDPGGGWVLRWFAGDTWRFDRDGRPVAVEDGFGTTRLHWVGERLVAMVAPTGRRVALDWNRDRVVAVRTGDGRVARYSYDAAGDLLGVARPAGDRSYRVDDAGLVVAVTDADGVDLLVNTYDEHGRVLTQTSPFGRRTRFTYRDDRSTVVDDDSGGPRTVYFHDAAGRLTGLVDDHGSRMVKLYDDRGNPIAIGDRAGAVVAQEFDERGNLLRRVEADGATTVQEWDALDRLVRRTDPTGATVALRYRGRDREPSLVVDPLGARTGIEVVAGLVMRVVDPDGVETRFARDRDGRVVAATDGTGAVTRFAYDAAGRLAAVTAADAATTALERDAAGRLVERRDPTGATTRWEWSAAGRELATVNAAGGASRREFGPHGEPVAVTDPAGAVTRLEWDRLGRMTRLVNPHGAKLDHRHDGLGRLVAVDDPAGGSVLREYDAEGRLLAVVDATGHRRERELDARGRVVRDESGGRHSYDAAGRRVQTVDAAGAAVSVAYDPAGRPVAVTDPAGGVTRYEWTPGGRLRRRVSPLGHATTWEYDAAGRAVAEVGPDGGRTEVRRDACGRVVATRSPGGLVTWLRHDAAGRVVARTDPSGAVTGFDHDPAGRLTAVTAPDGGVTRYTWSAGGRLTSVADAMGATTGFGYDDAGQLTSATDPLGGQQRYTFDGAGRLTGFTDQRGATTTLDLDAAGRVRSRTDPTGAELRLTYDAAGRVASFGGARVERDGAGRPVRYVEPSGRVTELRRDRAGRLVRWACQDDSLSWMWDADGRRTAVVHADGSTTRYAHDANGLLVGVEHPAGGRFTIERDADGRPVHLTGRGHERRWTWKAGRLARWESDGHAVDLARDRAGRVVAERSAAGDRAYGYDRAGRLLGAIDPGGAITTWTYDAAGRRTGEHGPSGERRFRHDRGHRLVGIDGPAGTTTLTWDDAGRRTAERHPDGATTSYRWDAWGRLQQVTRPDGTVIGLDVDARGSLRAVGDTGVVWDATCAVPQVRMLGKRPVTGPALAAGRCPLRPDVRGDLGGARDPWGLPAFAGTEPRLGYRGEVEFGGLVWLRHRVYDPTTAGFLGPDPLPPVAGAMNPYSYAGDDPVGSIDPLGLQPMSDADARQMREAQDEPWYEQAWDWAGDHGDEIGAGLLAAGAVAMIATGVGAPIGAGILLGMAVSGGVQLATSGEVDARQLWISGLAGGISGGAGAGAGVLTAGASTAVRVGAQVAAGAVTESGISAGSQYLTAGRVDGGRVLVDGTIGAVAGGAALALGGAASARLRGAAPAAMLNGSGPAHGVLEVSARVKSVGAFRNYTPSGRGVEYVFDPVGGRFAVGGPHASAGLKGSPHEQLAQSIDADPKHVVGGIFRRGPQGEMSTDEQSGHFYQNWTPEVRSQFPDFMKGFGFDVEH